MGIFLEMYEEWDKVSKGQAAAYQFEVVSSAPDPLLYSPP
jgi:hypothetical protein